MANYNGNNEDNTFTGTDRKDYINGQGGNDVLSGLAADDFIVGGEGDDTLIGGKGNDHLEGGLGADIYLISSQDGNDTIYGTLSANHNADDIVRFEGVASTDITSIRRVGDYDTFDLMISYGNNHRLTLEWYFYDATYRVKAFQFSDGVTWLWDEVRDKVLQGSNGNDTLLAYDDKQHNLFGGDGDDNLTGANLADTLTGGAGRDSMTGGEGADVYVIGKNDGKDVIFNDDTDHSVDVVKFLDVASTEITDVGLGDYYRIDSYYNTDLRLQYGNDSELVIWNFFGGAANRISEFQFSDGVIWRWADIKDKVLLGTNGNDQLYGYNGNSHQLSGLAGDDVIDGGNRNDTLNGGLGDDILTGNNGSDVYVFAQLEGMDVIHNYDSDGGLDVVKFIDVASTDSIRVSIVNFDGDFMDDLLVKFGADSQFIISNYFEYAENRVDQFLFSDGVIWDEAVIRTQAQQGTEGDDWLQLYSGNKLFGLGGNDVLWGNASNSRLNGGAGNDQLYGGSGNEKLIGGKGDDDLYGNAGRDTYVFNNDDGDDVIHSWGGDKVEFTDVASTEITQISRRSTSDLVVFYGIDNQLTIESYFDYRATGRFEFSDGVIWTYQDIKLKVLQGTEQDDYLVAYKNESAVLNGLAGNDQLVGANLNDVLNGGKGDDYLQGQNGDDLYLIDKASGKEFIFDTNGNDTVKFTRLSSSDLIAISQLPNGSNSLLLSFTDGTQVTIQDYFQQSLTTGSIEKFRFSDGVIWTFEHIQSRVSLASDGNNALYGGKGDDTLDGGLGNDYLQGGLGADTYVITLNGGQDILYDNDLYADTDTDVVLFSDVASVDITSVTFGYEGSFNNEYGYFYPYSDDLILTFGNRSQIIVVNYFGIAQGARIERFEFSDGIVWFYDDLLAKAQTIDDNNNVVHGIDYRANHLSGLGGNDRLYGGYSHNSLNGGPGDDFLKGNWRSDVYLFTHNDGHDRILEAGLTGHRYTDKVKFADVAISLDVSGFIRQDDDLVIDYGDTNQLTVENYFKSESASYLAIEKFVFIDSVVDYFVIGNSADAIWMGSNQNDALSGLSDSRNLEGRKGHDIYWVDDLGDTVIESAHSGTDTLISYINNSLPAHVENLVLLSTAKTATGNNLHNELTGNAIGNTLTGLAGSDTLFGQAGNDLLIGGDGRDVLVGGFGKDHIDLSETVSTTDIVVINPGDSRISNYDEVFGFTLGDGIASTTSDQLDLTFPTTIAVDSVATNGVNAAGIKSHALNQGIVSFDNQEFYSSPLSITASQLDDVLTYLSSNIAENEVVAFNAIGNTYVFVNNVSHDSLIQLTGVKADNLNTSGIVANGLWLS